jgi:hypothetical protein
MCWSTAGITIAPLDCDQRRPLQLSDIEPLFTCKACGKRGAEVRPDFPQARMATDA